MAYPRISVDGAIVVVTGGARGIGKVDGGVLHRRRSDGLRGRHRRW